MNNKNYANLKSWKKGQSGNPAGRKKGSKNVSTIVRQVLEQDMETDIPKFTQELEKVEERKEGLKEAVISQEKFLKLVKKAVDYIGEIEDLPQLDEILTKFYSNFIILNKSVSVITFNQEWYDVLNPVWLPLVDVLRNYFSSAGGKPSASRNAGVHSPQC